jgi:myo-inositol-1(or 4)-monophosphatase
MIVTELSAVDTRAQYMRRRFDAGPVRAASGSVRTMGEPSQPRAVDRDRDRAAELLDVATEAALTGGVLLRARFEAGREASVSSKSTPTDPVSEADLESQREIRALIARRRPQDGFLAEEEGADQRGSSGLRWVVDPLDGTVNFLYGIPQWSVSVAVCDAQQTLAGVIHAPISAETFTAVRGELPRRNGVELPWRGEVAPAISQALVATGFAYEAGVRAEQAELMTRLLPLVRDIRRFGSAAMDLAWTAMGRYDAYFERGVKLWDIAAGVLVCECVGLVAREIDKGILVAPPALLEALVAIVAYPGGAST